jgi:methylamine---glutamate N-methyltransferase subunit C
MTKVPNTEENKAKCICGRCPSYPKDCPGEILYCASGKSQCDINAAGCICPGCPIYPEYDLETLYFCNKDEIG